MIRADVNVVGTITKSAKIVNDKDNNPKLSFHVTVLLPSPTGDNKTITLYVSPQVQDNKYLETCMEGARVQMKGSLDILLRPNTTTDSSHPDLFFNLSASSINTENVTTLDSITGVMYFIGFTNKEDIKEKTDKNGSKYVAFTAYVSEKDKSTDKYCFQHVRFLQFPDVLNYSAPLCNSWLTPKMLIKVRGNLQLESYKGNLTITSRIFNIEKYEKKSQSTTDEQ